VLSAPSELIPRYSQLLKDVLKSTIGYFLPIMAGNRRATASRRVQPQFVATPLMIHPYAKPAEASLELAVSHGKATATSIRTVPFVLARTSCSSLGSGSPCLIRDAMAISITSWIS